MFNAPNVFQLKILKLHFRFVFVGDDTDEVVANESETENDRSLGESGQQQSGESCDYINL
jgi:hypothetical protein